MSARKFGPFGADVTLPVKGKIASKSYCLSPGAEGTLPKSYDGDWLESPNQKPLNICLISTNPIIKRFQFVNSPLISKLK